MMGVESSHLGKGNLHCWERKLRQSQPETETEPERAPFTPSKPFLFFSLLLLFLFSIFPTISFFSFLFQQNNETEMSWDNVVLIFVFLAPFLPWMLMMDIFYTQSRKYNTNMLKGHIVRLCKKTFIFLFLHKLNGLNIAAVYQLELCSHFSLCMSFWAIVECISIHKDRLFQFRI